MMLTMRPAQAGDIQNITGIFRRAVADMCDRFIFQWDYVYPTEDTLRQDIDNGNMYVLCHGKDIVGAVAVSEHQQEAYSKGRWRCSEPAAVIHRLCIDPPHQHKGYGKQAMQLAHIMLKDRGFKSVRLEAFSQNPHALNLYESLGYIQAGEVMFRKGLFYFFEKSL